MAEGSFGSVVASDQDPNIALDEVPNASAIEAPTLVVVNNTNEEEEDPLNTAANESEMSFVDNTIAVAETVATNDEGGGKESMTALAELKAEPELQNIAGEASITLEMTVDEEEPAEPKQALHSTKDIYEEKIRFLEERIAAAEKDRDNTNVMMANTANRNAAFKRDLEIYKQEASERTAYIRNLEADNFRIRKECDFLRQKSELNEREASKWKVDSERHVLQVQTLNEQLTTVKIETNELRDKSLILQAELNTLKDNFQAIKSECDNYKSQVRLLQSSKQFFVEVELQAQDEKDDLRMKLFRLESEAAVAIGSQELCRQQMIVEQRRFEQIIANKDTELADLQIQLQNLKNNHELLQQDLKTTVSERQDLQFKLNESFTETNNERNQMAQIREQYKQKLAEFEGQLESGCKELEQTQLKAEEELRSRDEQVKILRTEIDKLNEKLQLYAKMSNASNPEVMAPAAARTASMMKNANSLTEIYAEHFSLIAELESKKADLRHAEQTMIQLREMLVEHSPLIRERQDQLEQANREVEIMREQLDRHQRYHDDLVASRDSYLNELRFTKDSLEKYQRECQTLSKQVQHLTLQTSSQNVDESAFEESDELFSNVQELQQRNLELISRIQTMEVEKDEAIRNAQDAQFNELKQKLEVATQNAETIELRNKHLLTCKNEAEKQRDYYKKAFDEMQKRCDDSMDPLRVAELKRNLEAAQERAELSDQHFEKLKEQLSTNEQQAKTKDEVWFQANNDLKKLVASLNTNVERKQNELNELLVNKRSVEHKFHELDIRHKLQSNYVALLQRANQVLIEKSAKLDEELRQLKSTKLELNKELAQWRNASTISQLELNTIRQELHFDVSVTSALNELSSVIDRKKLLMESLQESAVAKLSKECTHLKQQVDEIKSEKTTTENELRAEILKFQSECTRLEIEYETTSKLIAPLGVENSELHARCRELTDDLIAAQKQISESVMIRSTMTATLNDAALLRKQLNEMLSTAEYWQTRYEKLVLKRANITETSMAGCQLSTCSEPGHALLITYITECKERLEDNVQRIMGLLNQISTLETKSRQLEDDMQLADTMTNSQAERITQMETDTKQLIDKYNEVSSDLERFKLEHSSLMAKFEETTTKLKSTEEENQRLKQSLIEEQNNKLHYQKLLEQTQTELSIHMDELRAHKSVIATDFRRVEADLVEAQQRELDLNQRLSDARKEFEQLITTDDKDSVIASFKRVLGHMREERSNETLMRFKLTVETKELRSENEKQRETILNLESQLVSAQQDVQLKDDLLGQQSNKIELFNSLQYQIDKLTEERNSLQRITIDLKTERERLIERADSETANRDSQIQTLNQQIDALETKLTASIEKENKLKGDITTLEEREKKLRTMAIKFKKECEELKTAATPSEQQMSMLQKEKIALQKDKDDIVRNNQLQLQKLNDELAFKNKELEEMRIKLSSAQESISNVTNQSSAAPCPEAASRLVNPLRSIVGRQLGVPAVRANTARELQLKTRQLQELKSKNKELEDKLAETEQRIKQREVQLKAEADRLNEQILDLMQESGEKQRELIEKIRQLEQKTEEIGHLNMRNKMIEGTLETTRKKYENTKEELEIVRAQLDSANQQVLAP